MSDIQPAFLESNTQGAHTLAEAFGFSLFDLHITNEQGVDVSSSVREKVILGVLGEDANNSQIARSHCSVFEKVARMPGTRLYNFFFGDKKKD